MIEIHNGLLFMFLLFLPFIVIAVLSFMNSIRKSRREKAEQERYRSENVKEITLTDALFGSISAIHDRFTETLTANDITLPEFGCAAPSCLTVYGYTGREDTEIIRMLNFAYRNADGILRKLAEAVLREMPADEEENLPEIGALVQQIIVTEFQLTFADSTVFMLMQAGLDDENDTYSLSAMYKKDADNWEYEAERIGGDAE